MLCYVMLCAIVYFVLSMKLIERPNTVYFSAAKGTVGGVKRGDVFGSL
jgi:hypothetical protein